MRAMTPDRLPPRTERERCGLPAAGIHTALAARRAWTLLALPLAMCCVAARANDSAGSELSHVVAGAAIASAGTVVADHFGIERRGWVGFSVSVGVSLVEEVPQVISNGRSQLHGSALDFGCNMIGAAIGAWVTDRYVLQPVVSHDASGHRVIGVALQKPF